MTAAFTLGAEREPGKVYQPSNATEFDAFYSQVCASCRHDDKDDCEIIGYAMAFRPEDDLYPKEWIYNKDGRATCTAYEFNNGGEDDAKEASVPGYRCDETLNLFTGGTENE